MKRSLLLTLLAVLLPLPSLSASPGNIPYTPPPEEVSGNPAAPVPTEARRLALETAGAFLNDGFRIRDGEWSSSLPREGGAPLFLQVTLFSGNRYWFVAATPVPGVTVKLTLFDASGKPVSSDQWKGQGVTGVPTSRAAAGVAPERSGKYFVSVETFGKSPDGSDFCLVYAYK